MSIFLSLLLLFFTAPVSPSFSPDRYTKSLPSYHKPREYLELGLPRPLPSDFLVPSCSKQILRHSFTNSINAPPFSTHYSAPSNCLSPSSDCLDFGLFQSLADMTRFGLNRWFQPIRHKSPWFSTSRRESLKKKKETRGRRGRAPTCRQRCPCASLRHAMSDAGAAPQTASPCFLLKLLDRQRLIFFKIIIVIIKRQQSWFGLIKSS